MVLNARHRYIVLNVGLWLLLAIGGGAGIVLLRQYGAAIAAHERARALLARAETHYDDGDLATCQAELLQAITLSPTSLGELLDRFGARITGLPNALEQLAANAKLSRGPSTPEALAQAQLDLVRGDAAHASQRLEQYVTAGGPDPRASLWRGRIALNEAQFTQARDEFTRYWQANASAKAAFTAALHRSANGTGAEQRMQDGRALFWAGLWDDAFNAFAEALRAGATDPELEFYQGVSADLAGKTNEARAHYTKTLDKLPNHLLTLRRLKALSTASQSK